MREMRPARPPTQRARPSSEIDAAAPAPGPQGDAGAAPLPAPAALRRTVPANEAARTTVRAARAALRAALGGGDARLVVVVGPCSVHDPDAAGEYARRLAEAARRHADALLVVMRTYFEKPRTALGWKGLLRDPHRDGSPDVAEGLLRARRLLAEVSALGLPCGSELLDPLTAPHLADLLAWACVGARTVESPLHREMASGLELPVGFKNPTDGRTTPAADAMRAAAAPHTALVLGEDGRAAVRRTPGNPDTHLVLRGGAGGPNHGADAIAAAAARARALGVARGVLVDCAHGNSGKRAARQPAVCREVLGHLRCGRAPGLLGVMLESHLHPGRQDPGAQPLRYGVSITDECLGWEATADLLEEIATAAREVAQSGGAPLRPRAPSRAGPE